MTAITGVVFFILFVWAFAEAFSWPVVPDAALVAVVFIDPTTAVGATAAVVTGSAIGGAVAITMHRRGVRWPTPATTVAMRIRVKHWMGRGPTGLIHQPLTAVPYKIFVIEAATLSVTPVRWGLLTAAFRGPRMAIAAVLAVSGSQLVAATVPTDGVSEAKAVALTIGAVLFLAGWRLAWRLWSTKGGTDSSEPTAHTHDRSTPRTMEAP